MTNETVMKASELLAVLTSVSWSQAEARIVSRLIAEVFRLRAKQRYQARRISDLEALLEQKPTPKDGLELEATSGKEKAG
jgi:hypothetical protein